MSYATPIISLGLLVAFSRVSVAQLDFLFIGAIIVIIANLLINLKAQIRIGFKCLILALVMGGSIVYLRDDIFEIFAVERWHWTAGGYFEALALSATVFTLLLAFRVSRLISRAGEEEGRTFQALRRFDMLVKRDVICNKILNCMGRIDSPKSEEDLRNAYFEARNYINSAKAKAHSMKDVDVQLLSEAEAHLDALARSKQQDITPGEMFALCTFAVITVALAMASRPPESEGWTRFLVDIFAVLISSVIVFLVVNVWELRRERDEKKFDLMPETQDYRVQFIENRNGTFDQKLSLIAGGAIVLMFASLLAHKWVGWFSWLG